MSFPRPGTAGYRPQPWTCEDGGPRRWGSAAGVAGLGIGPGEGLSVTAVRDAFAIGALVRRDPGELYALRHDVPVFGTHTRPVEAWVERLDPDSLAVVGATPRLPGGPFWPGGIAVHRSGDIHVVFGRHAHRLGPGLEVLASSRLPVERPYNSFVVLDGGELVMKDCDAPRGLAPSTVSALDPETLLPVAEPLPLPEPSIARLSSDGDSVIVVGTTRLFRVRLDRDAGRLELDAAWSPAYGPEPDRSYGWDPVLTDEHVLWLDQGRNRTDRTMLGSGEEAGPVRLWWARLDDGAVGSTEVCGLPFGTVSNPPAWDPGTRTIVAYDSGNGVIGAWRFADGGAEPIWRRDDIAHAGHLIAYPDTRELLVGDWRDLPLLRRPGIRPLMRAAGRAGSRFAAARQASLRSGHDEAVVLDLDTGAEKARVAVPSASQGFLFPAPGFGRDFYYQSITTIARVEVT
ncbi:MAG: hypothetical protein U0R51_09605 [Solirubrobacterales bacterium]